ncbi:carotenoid oxygenase family protein, partial [Halorientalis sp.]
MTSSLGFHSLEEERATSLAVTGSVPEWLTGSLVRNGPGRFDLPDGSSV